MTDLYVIEKDGYYFRPNAAGYTALLREAGLYSKEDAFSYALDGYRIRRQVDATAISRGCTDPHVVAAEYKTLYEAEKVVNETYKKALQIRKGREIVLGNGTMIVAPAISPAGVTMAFIEDDQAAPGDDLSGSRVPEEVQKRLFNGKVYPETAVSDIPNDAVILHFKTPASVGHHIRRLAECAYELWGEVDLDDIDIDETAVSQDA